MSDEEDIRLNEYEKYLEKEKITSKEIEKRLSIIKDLYWFVSELDSGKTVATTGREEVEDYSRKLISEGNNTFENFIFLRQYAAWLDSRDFYVAMVEVMECSNTLEVLTEKIQESHGKEMRDRIFTEELPPLGASDREKYLYTRKILERMEQYLTPDESGKVWFRVQHGIPAEHWKRADKQDRERFQKCNSIEEYLDIKWKERNTRLTGLKNEGKLWYTQEIDDEVLEFATSNQEIEGGRLDGNSVYITKIPYNTRQYLNTTDERMKRYYACHCPLVRESILEGAPVSSHICQCSLGHASHYLAGIGRDLEGEVLESVIRGDTRCRFVFHLLPDAGGE